MTDHLLEVRNLTVDFHTAQGTVHAVRDVNWHLDRGETLAILGESRVGQVGVGFGDHEPDRLPAGRDRLGRGPVQRQGPAADERGRAARDQRPADRDDLPGSAQPPEPGLYGRLPDRRDDDRPRQAAGRGPGAHARAPETGRHPRRGQQDRRLSAPVLGRTAAAADDRHGAGAEARHPDRGRADDGAGCHGAGADPGAARGAAGGDGDGPPADHPRSGRGGRDRRPRRGDELWPDRRDGQRGAGLPEPNPPLHQEADRRRARHGRDGRTPRHRHQADPRGQRPLQVLRLLRGDEALQPDRLAGRDGGDRGRSPAPASRRWPRRCSGSKTRAGARRSTTGATW